jgi:hypothetical protein
MSQTTQQPEASTPTKRPTLATVLSLVAVAMSAAALIVSLLAFGGIEQQGKEDRVDECSEKYETGSMDWFMCAEQAQ